MRFLYLLLQPLLLGVGKTASLPHGPVNLDLAPQVTTAPETAIKVHVSEDPRTVLPPPNTPCKRKCSCTHGTQPPEGRVYCGYCWGVDPVNDILYGSEVIKCSPGDCCSYGYYDGRCDTNHTQPEYDVFCKNS
ncbi:uncharacterized protein EI97DRAFT_292310 [Westerdykella ornata]|uniref:Uncharacterized protein n=1 Tax=Westerdykella ornata TaxID=318751 RepID=A0A6A6JLR8_WESOR|nr:uncharacterized protein EI97DRAFT_292310 [Westerdykella ornata]KAF2277452.1 hypothetical protein EI97DRAFT_292310 [Westerdykella ornata]